MSKKISGGLVAAAVVAVLAAPVAPAAASASYDCTILGPAYVQEVVDCAFYILEHLA